MSLFIVDCIIFNSAPHHNYTSISGSRSGPGKLIGIISVVYRCTTVMQNPITSYYFFILRKAGLFSSCKSKAFVVKKK